MHILKNFLSLNMLCSTGKTCATPATCYCLFVETRNILSLSLQDPQFTTNICSGGARFNQTCRILYNITCRWRARTVCRNERGGPVGRAGPQNSRRAAPALRGSHVHNQVKPLVPSEMKSLVRQRNLSHDSEIRWNRVKSVMRQLQTCLWKCPSIMIQSV
jgi:hypothetical protein